MRGAMRANRLATLDGAVPASALDGEIPSLHQQLLLLVGEPVGPIPSAPQPQPQPKPAAVAVQPEQKKINKRKGAAAPAAPAAKTPPPAPARASGLRASAAVRAAAPATPAGVGVAVVLIRGSEADEAATGDEAAKAAAAAKVYAAASAAAAKAEAEKAAKVAGAKAEAEAEAEVEEAAKAAKVKAADAVKAAKAAKAAKAQAAADKAAAEKAAAEKAAAAAKAFVDKVATAAVRAGVDDPASEHAHKKSLLRQSARASAATTKSDQRGHRLEQIVEARGEEKKPKIKPADAYEANRDAIDVIWAEKWGDPTKARRDMAKALAAAASAEKALENIKGAAAELAKATGANADVMQPLEQCVCEKVFEVLGSGVPPSPPAQVLNALAPLLKHCPPGVDAVSELLAAAKCGAPPTEEQLRGLRATQPAWSALALVLSSSAVEASRLVALADAAHAGTEEQRTALLSALRLAGATSAQVEAAETEAKKRREAAAVEAAVRAAEAAARALEAAARAAEGHALLAQQIALKAAIPLKRTGVSAEVVVEQVVPLLETVLLQVLQNEGKTSPEAEKAATELAKVIPSGPSGSSSWVLYELSHLKEPAAVPALVLGKLMDALLRDAADAVQRAAVPSTPGPDDGAAVQRKAAQQEAVRAGAGAAAANGAQAAPAAHGDTGISSMVERRMAELHAQQAAVAVAVAGLSPDKIKADRQRRSVTDIVELRLANAKVWRMRLRADGFDVACAGGAPSADPKDARCETRQSEALAKAMRLLAAKSPPIVDLVVTVSKLLEPCAERLNEMYVLLSAFECEPWPCAAKPALTVESAMRDDPGLGRVLRALAVAHPAAIEALRDELAKLEKASGLEVLFVALALLGHTPAPEASRRGQVVAVFEASCFKLASRAVKQLDAEVKPLDALDTQPETENTPAELQPETAEASEAQQEAQPEAGSKGAAERDEAERDSSPGGTAASGGSDGAIASLGDAQSSPGASDAAGGGLQPAVEVEKAAGGVDAATRTAASLGAGDASDDAASSGTITAPSASTVLGANDAAGSVETAAEAAEEAAGWVGQLAAAPGPDGTALGLYTAQVARPRGGARSGPPSEEERSDDQETAHASPMSGAGSDAAEASPLPHAAHAVADADAAAGGALPVAGGHKRAHTPTVTRPSVVDRGSGSPHSDSNRGAAAMLDAGAAATAAGIGGHAAAEVADVEAADPGALTGSVAPAAAAAAAHAAAEARLDAAAAARMEALGVEQQYLGGAFDAAVGAGGVAAAPAAPAPGAPGAPAVPPAPAVAAAAAAGGAAAAAPLVGGAVPAAGFMLRPNTFTVAQLYASGTILRVEDGRTGNAVGEVCFCGPKGILTVLVSVVSLLPPYGLRVKINQSAWFLLTTVNATHNLNKTFVEMKVQGERVALFIWCEKVSTDKTKMKLVMWHPPPGAGGPPAGGALAAVPLPAPGPAHAGGAGVGHATVPLLAAAGAPPSPAAPVQQPAAVAQQPQPRVPLLPPHPALPHGAPAPLPVMPVLASDSDDDAPNHDIGYADMLAADGATHAGAAQQPAPLLGAADRQLGGAGPAPVELPAEAFPALQRFDAAVAAAGCGHTDGGAGGRGVGGDGRALASAGAGKQGPTEFAERRVAPPVAPPAALPAPAAQPAPVQSLDEHDTGAVRLQQTQVAVNRTLVTVNARLALWSNPRNTGVRTNSRNGHADKAVAAAAPLLKPAAVIFVSRLELLKIVMALVTADHPAVKPGSLAGVAAAPPAAAAPLGHSAQARGPSDAGAATAPAATSATATTASAAVAELHAKSRAFVEDGTMRSLALAGLGTNVEDFLLLPEKNDQLLGVSTALVRVIAVMPRDLNGHLTPGCNCNNVHLVPVGAAPATLPSQLAATPVGRPAAVLRMRRCAVEAATAGTAYPTVGHAAAALRGLLSAPETPKMALVSREQMVRVWAAHMQATRAQLPSPVTDAAAVAAALACPGVLQLVTASPLPWASSVELAAVESKLSALIAAGKGKKLVIENLADLTCSLAALVLDTKSGLNTTLDRAATVECLAHATETALETGALPLQVVVRAVAEQATKDNSHPLQLCMVKELLEKIMVMLPRTLGGVLYRLFRRLEAAPDEAERGRVAMLMVDVADAAAEASGGDAGAVWRLLNADAVVVVARAAVEASSCPALQALAAQMLVHGTNATRNATSLLEMCSLGDVKPHALGAVFARDAAEMSRMCTFVQLGRLYAKGMRLGEVTPYGALAGRLRMCESGEGTAAHEYTSALNCVANDCRRVSWRASARWCRPPACCASLPCCEPRTQRSWIFPTPSSRSAPPLPQRWSTPSRTVK